MNEQDKNLLLNDLCARLTHGVKIKFVPNETIKDIIYVIDGEYSYTPPNYTILNEENVKYLFNGYWKEYKPYLFPLSSMTDEQKKELDEKFHLMGIYGNNILIHYHSQGYWDTDLEVDFQDWLWLIDWLNKNHFDYRGLIEKGLAIDATNLNIY